LREKYKIERLILKQNIMKNLFKYALLFFISISYSQNEKLYEETSVIKIGDKTPTFKYLNNNDEVLNSSDLNGKIILINFFATWCAPCMTEMPYLEKEIWEKYKTNNNFELIAFGRGHSLEETNAFIAKKKFSFSIFPDKEKSIYNLFATQFIPRNYLFDKHGKLVYTSVGFSVEEFKKLKDKIEELIKQN
jgi:peroxiredoxin